MSTAQNLAAVLESLKKEAAQHFGGLKGSASHEDLIQEAYLKTLEGLSVEAAVAAAYNELRGERISVMGEQQNVSFAYLSQVVGASDSEPLTVADTISDEAPRYFSGLSAAERAQAAVWIAEGTLAEQVGAARIAGAERAHGSDAAARGAANAERGALNDALILSLVERVGGKHYGYAKKVAALLLEEHGITLSVEATLMAISRATKRTEGTDPHSSRD